jgi:hypothetical protein
MSKTQGRRSSTADGEGKSARGEYEVGYSRPPTAHQFKPGRSGNAKGRPKGAKNQATIVREIVNMKVAMRVGGRTRKVPYLKAMWTRVADDALKGNSKAITLLRDEVRLIEERAPETSRIHQNDKEILEAYLAARDKAKGADS